MSKKFIVGPLWNISLQTVIDRFSLGFSLDYQTSYFLLLDDVGLDVDLVGDFLVGVRMPVDDARLPVDEGVREGVDFTELALELLVD